MEGPGRHLGGDATPFCPLPITLRLSQVGKEFAAKLRIRFGGRDDAFVGCVQQRTTLGGGA